MKQYKNPQMQPSLSDILQIPLNERMEWVEAIWNSIAKEKQQNSYELSREHISILDEELEAYHTNPGEGSEWKDIKKRILGG